MLSLLFGFHGRINRAKYWFGSLLMGFGGFMAIVLLMAMSSGAAMDAKTKGEKFAILSSGMLLLVPVFALMVWAGLAIQVKRFHDRGHTGWMTALPLAVAVPMMLTVFNGIVSNAPPLELIASVQTYAFVLWAINLWFFIELGCLPSKDGPNRYGDPPGIGGISTPQPAPSGPTPSTASALGMQAAMERAIAQRDTKAPVKPSASMQPPAFASAGAPSGARGFGRRTR